MVLAQIAAAMIYLVIAVETQKQRIVVGRWSWRFSLAGMLWITVVVAVLLAVALNIAQSTQREFAFGKKVVETIQAATWYKTNRRSPNRDGRAMRITVDYGAINLAVAIRSNSTFVGEISA